MITNNEESISDHDNVVSTRCAMFTRARTKGKSKQRGESFRSIRERSNQVLNRILKRTNTGNTSSDISTNRSSLSSSNTRKNVSLPPLDISDHMCSSVNSKDSRFQIHRNLSKKSTFGERSTNDFHGEVEVFSIWQLTSNDAIQMMMKGEGTGQGLNVKGKSAKIGRLSGLISFVQIHEEDHKKKIRWPPRSAPIRKYFKSEAVRSKAAFELDTLSNEMKVTVSAAKEIITEESYADDGRSKGLSA